MINDMRAFGATFYSASRLGLTAALHACVKCDCCSASIQ
jgi:hypothetical protein